MTQNAPGLVARLGLMASINHVQQFLSLGRRRQVLVAALRHQDAVLGAAAANGVVALDDIPVDELAVDRVLAEEALEVRAVKVQARLDGEDHAGAEHSALLVGRRRLAEPVDGEESRRRHQAALAARDAARDGRGVGGQHQGRVADHVVHLEADVVAEAVCEKGGDGAGGDELLAGAAQDTKLEEAVDGDVAGVDVDFVKELAGLHERDALVLHARDDVADGGRTRRKGPRDGQRARHVAGIAAVLAPGIKDNVGVALERRIVGAVVQRRAVGARAGNDGVRLAVGVARGADGLEDGLQLALVVHAAQGLGDAAVRRAGDVVGAANQRNLVRVLDLAGAVHGRLQGGRVNLGPVGRARAEGLVLDELGWALVRVQRVDGRRGGKGGEVAGEVAGVVYLVGIVQTRSLGGGRGRAEPMALLGFGVGNPEDERVEGNVVGDGAARIVDAGEVVKAEACVRRSARVYRWYTSI